MFGFHEWYPQDAEKDAGGAGGDSGLPEKKKFVEDHVQERYRPREVREVLAKYGEKADVALENVISQNNDLVQRLMRKQAELEYDLLAAQKQIKGLADEKGAIEAERDGFKQNLERIEAGKKSEKIDELLAAKYSDPTIVRRHKAYLKLEGYELDLDGDHLMLTKAEKRYRWDTVVNDAFYSTYTDAKPRGDLPLPSNGQPGNPAPQKNLGSQAAALWRESAASTGGAPPQKG